MTLKAYKKPYWSRAKNPFLRMWRNHLKLVYWYGAEFYNHASSSGDDFVSSRTSMGRVTSKIVNGRVRHYLGDGQVPMRGVPRGACG